MYRRIFQLLAVAVAVLVVDLPSADAFGRFRARSRSSQGSCSGRFHARSASHMRGTVRGVGIGSCSPSATAGSCQGGACAPAPKLMPK